MEEILLEIYLDIVFMENVLMNFIIIFACGFVMKYKIRKWRVTIASTLGSVYTIVMYLNLIPIYSSIVMKIILSVVMVYISFGARNVKKLLKELLIFYLVSFLFGGCVFALLYFLKPQLVEIRNGVYVGLYPIKMAIIGGAIAFTLMQIGFKLIKNRITKKDMIYEIEIIILNKKVKVKALLDTGNLLREPITRSSSSYC